MGVVEAVSREHGTHVKYVVERCRCPECRAANRVYERRRSRENAERKYGARPPIFVDASDARAHLFALSAAGIGPKQVERLCGVGKTAQWKIRSGRVRRIRRQTEHAIFSVAEDAHVFLGSRTDASEARQIVDALVRMGMTKGGIAQALGCRTRALQCARTERCTVLTLKRLRLLHAAALRGLV